MSDPDFAHSTTNIGWHIYVGTITTIIPATLCVAGRFLARHISRAGYWWDDWTILLALAINWAMDITRWVAVIHFGHGRHAATLPAETVSEFQKSFLAVQMTYFASAITTKAALLFLYYRIFGVVHSFRIALYVSAFIIAGYFVACVIVAIAGCHPASYFWNKAQAGYCINETNFFRWNGICSMLMDFLCLLLPLPLAWRIKATIKQKLILSSIFLLGFFTCIVSVLRILAFNGSQEGDPTYTTVDTAMLSSIEQSMAIICACLPTMRPIFRRLYGSTQEDKSVNSGTRRTRSSTIQLSNVSGSADEDHSTRGFARLPDEPMDSSRNGTRIYAGQTADMHSSVSRLEPELTDPDLIPTAITKRTEFHQVSTRA